MSSPTPYISSIARTARRAVLHPSAGIPLQTFSFHAHPAPSSGQRKDLKDFRPTPPHERDPRIPESSPGGPTFVPPEEEDPMEESVMEHWDELEEAAARGELDGDGEHRPSAYRDGEDELAFERASDKPAKHTAGDREGRGTDDMGKNTAGEAGPAEAGCRERYKRNEERLKAKLERGEPGM